MYNTVPFIGQGNNLRVLEGGASSAAETLFYRLPCFVRRRQRARAARRLAAPRLGRHELGKPPLAGRPRKLVQCPKTERSKPIRAARKAHGALADCPSSATPFSHHVRVPPLALARCCSVQKFILPLLRHLEEPIQ